MSPRARHDVAVTRGWLDQGTRLLVDAVARVPDDALRGPSRLPGWSRAHVVAHAARNAEALGRLAAWARTGVETPMYAGRDVRDVRDADIARTAQQAPAALRRDLAVTATTLDEALDGLDEDAWQATVRAGAAGHEVRAAVVPWLRVREVWLHRADLAEPGLDARDGLAGAPPALLEELVRDVAGTLSADAVCPRLDLRPDDLDVVVPLGADGPGSGRSQVRGPAADLLLWLAGRSDGQGLVTGSVLPPLPRWL